MLYQGRHVIPLELLISMQNQARSSRLLQLTIKGRLEDMKIHHDALICVFFAHADLLAFGTRPGKNASKRFFQSI